MGWSVINVSSGEDASRYSRHMRERDTPVDMVILDLILPCGMSGLDTVRHLRDIQPDDRILACSGFFGDESARTRASASASTRCIEKPFTPEDLAPRSEVRDAAHRTRPKCRRRATLAPA